MSGSWRLTLPYLQRIGVLPGGADCAPASPPSLRVLTFNVLFPNSTPTVWWIYKYYNAVSPSDTLGLPVAEASSWAHRLQLMRKIIADADAHVVCLQEAFSDRSLAKAERELHPEKVGEQFYKDFAFMLSEGLGYEGLGYECTLMTKGGIRPATFWRTDSASFRIQDLGSTHQYRVLTKLFALQRPGGSSRHLLAVINGHFPGGPVPDKRVSCLADALKAAEKMVKSAGGSASTCSVLVCGDFNAGDGNACDVFLRSGELSPDTLEDGAQVTSKVRKHTFVQFSDCGADCGPTLIVQDLEPRMRRTLRLAGYKQNEKGERVPADLDEELTCEEQARKHLPEAFVDMLRECYGKYTGDSTRTTQEMGAREIERWQLDVNGQTAGRGTGREFLAGKAEKTLSFWEFCFVYLEEIREGKFWSVESDIRSMIGRSAMELPGVDGVVPGVDGVDSNLHYYAARYDRAYLSSSVLTQRSARVLCDREGAREFVLPNAWHPSDHLPLLVEFELSP